MFQRKMAILSWFLGASSLVVAMMKVLFLKSSLRVERDLKSDAQDGDFLMETSIL